MGKEKSDIRKFRAVERVKQRDRQKDPGACRKGDLALILAHSSYSYKGAPT